MSNDSGAGATGAAMALLSHSAMRKGRGEFMLSTKQYQFRFCSGDFAFKIKRDLFEKVLGMGMARPVKGVVVSPVGWTGKTWRVLIAEAESVLRNYPVTPHGWEVDHLHIPEGGEVVHLGLLPEGLVQSGFSEPLSLDKLVEAEGEISLDVCHQEEY